MIEIHRSYGYKMSVVAMGEFAKDTVRTTFSSFRGTNSKISYVGTDNPAMVSYMVLVGYNAPAPAQTNVSYAELTVDAMFGVSATDAPVATCEWTVYQRDFLYTIFNKDNIGALTRALADHAVEYLLDQFVNMANSLFNVTGSIPTSYRPGAVPDTDDTASVGGQHQGGLGSGHGDGGGSQPQSVFVNQGGSQFRSAQESDGSGTASGGGQYNSVPGSMFVGKNSTTAQMNDWTGKSKSQQVIVLENMVNKVEQILESYRSRDKVIAKMCDMMEIIIDANSVDDDELTAVIETVKERFPRCL